MGVPFGLLYVVGELSNDQSRAPDAIRQNAQDAAWEEPRTRTYFDWDLGGPLLDNPPSNDGNPKVALQHPNYLRRLALGRFH